MSRGTAGARLIPDSSRTLTPTLIRESGDLRESADPLRSSRKVIAAAEVHATSMSNRSALKYRCQIISLLIPESSSSYSVVILLVKLQYTEFSHLNTFWSTVSYFV